MVGRDCACGCVTTQHFPQRAELCARSFDLTTQCLGRLLAISAFGRAMEADLEVLDSLRGVDNHADEEDSERSDAF